MTKEIYEDIYGNPADIDKVWVDRDALYDGGFAVQVLQGRALSANMRYQFDHLASGIEAMEAERTKRILRDAVGCIAIFTTLVVLISVLT